MMIIIISLLTTPTQQASSVDGYVFGGCSQYKYIPGSSYENNVNTLLTSLVNSAMFMSYNNFTIKGTTSSHDNLYGLFQCRGDLDADGCSRCVSSAVTQLGTLCTGATGGALQLEGCFVKYDNATFLGVEDKTVVVRKCGPMVGYDSDVLTKRDSVLGYIGAYDGSYKAYRVGWSGNVRGEAQCVQDLSGSECQDCLTEAIGRLKNDCGPARSGDMFLAKCYARYSAVGDHSQYHDGNGGKHVISLDFEFFELVTSVNNNLKKNVYILN